MRKDYNSETIFPWSLVSETISIAKDKNAKFATYSEKSVSRNLRILDFYHYLIEYSSFKTQSPSFISRHIFIALFVLSKFYRKPAYRKWLSEYYSGDDREVEVFFQHDADRQPYKTIEMMLLEREHGARSSNFFFRHRHMWDGDDEPYELEIEELQNLEKQGFEIGYHLNAYELAGYDVKKFAELINNDLDFFEQHFNVQTFVPHGGVPGPSGINNESIPYAGRLRNYLWAYNGNGLFRDLSWSDGHVYFESIEDPRIVANQLRGGHRALFLMHPQYYGDKLMPEYEHLPIAKEKWWRDLWSLD